MIEDLWKQVQPYVPNISVPQEQRETRIDICQSCDKLTEKKFCSECNCFMPLKTWINVATCPLEKW
jgi:hypothetical protein